MNPSGAYGMYAQDAQLEQVMLTLNQSGFDKQDICMMVSPSHPLAKVLRQGEVLNADRESGIAAGLMRWLLEFGAVMVPTVGFFIRSQAFLRALVTGKESASLCGKSRPLVGLGFSEYDAERFESQLRDVGVLVYVGIGLVVVGRRVFDVPWRLRIPQRPRQLSHRTPLLPQRTQSRRATHGGLAGLLVRGGAGHLVHWYDLTGLDRSQETATGVAGARVRDHTGVDVGDLSGHVLAHATAVDALAIGADRRRRHSLRPLRYAFGLSSFRRIAATRPTAGHGDLSFSTVFARVGHWNQMNE